MHQLYKSDNKLIIGNRRNQCDQTVSLIESQCHHLLSIMNLNMNFRIFRMVIETIFLGVFILALVWYLKVFIRPKAFPPGPIPLPVIGNIHLLGSEPHKACKKLSAKYGDVFSLFFGGYKVVIVSSIDAAKESLIQKSSDFAGRPASYTGIETAKGKATGRGIDIVYSDYGPYWQTIRKLAHKALRMYGANRTELEKVINIHSAELIERLSKKCGEDFDPKRDLCKYQLLIK